MAKSHPKPKHEKIIRCTECGTPIEILYHDMAICDLCLDQLADDLQEPYNEYLANQGE